MSQFIKGFIQALLNIITLTLQLVVRQPQEKGKVEAAIKYIKGSFFAGRSVANFEQLSPELKFWLEHKCNLRIHGTTKKVPQELFDLEERAALNPLPISDFNITTVGQRKVHTDCHISVEGNYYSVPYKYVGMIVEIHLQFELLKIYHLLELIALHPRYHGKGKFITDNSTLLSIIPYICQANDKELIQL